MLVILKKERIYNKKEKKQQCGSDRCNNILEHEKQRSVEYKKII